MPVVKIFLVDDHDVVRTDARVIILTPQLVARLNVSEPPRPRGDVLGVLSGRERVILRLAADCRRSSEIADQLHISRRTVDQSIKTINRKLGLRDRAELVRFALSMGFLHSMRGAPSPSA